MHKNLFIPFIVAGDPSPDATIDLALALQEVGADVIEIGIPYSDPLADGPVIQRAAARSLKNGTTLKSSLELIGKMRKKGLKIPVVVFTYFNPVLQLGEESFFALARENEVDGLLIPDLPFEESEDLRLACRENGIEFISMIAPTSTSRIEKIAKSAQGFLYCVSSLGVTGVRDSLNTEVYSFLNQVKRFSKVPVVVGFGISTDSQVKALQDHCEGIVIGSAIVNKIEMLENRLLHEDTRKEALEEFSSYIGSIISPITRLGV
ncbi:tryptophan synthase subunit alpha [Cytobacillus suaedae]|nr:tryptophan synthase subunit alpha [Cytobacillus suaedae]